MKEKGLGVRSQASGGRKIQAQAIFLPFTAIPLTLKEIKDYTAPQRQSVSRWPVVIPDFLRVKVKY